MKKFKFSNFNNGPLNHNPKHKFAINHTMMIYEKNSLYTLIPKNACSTMRLTIAIENGCISDITQGNWIHANNNTFNATLKEAITAKYKFIILRCPFRRLASVFLDKFVEKEVEAWKYREIQNRTINLSNITFKDFVLSLRNSTILNSNIHWRKQSDFLLYNEYDDYFCLEKFSHAEKTLKNKIDLNIHDARSLTLHGTESFEKIENTSFSNISANEILQHKLDGRCPTHMSLYDKEIIDTVKNIYAEDISLYLDKIGDKGLLFS